MSNSKSIIIIGGGLGGLALAQLIALQNKNIQVNFFFFCFSFFAISQFFFSKYLRSQFTNVTQTVMQDFKDFGSE